MDKIKLFTPDKTIITQEQIKENFNYVTSTHKELNNNTRSTHCNKKKVFVTTDKFGLYLEVNPTAYISGTNIEQINRTGMINFIDQFEEDLQLNSNLFKLTGFDFNGNIITEYPPATYFPVLRDLSKYSKTQYKYGITYKNGCKSYSIYDKQEQLRMLPAPDTNIMRIELGVNNRVNNTKNLANIKSLRDLTQRDNYVMVTKQWQSMYEKINKQSNIYKIREMNLPVNWDVNDFAIVFLINELKVDGYNNLLEIQKQKKQITKRQFNCRKKKAENLWEKYLVDGEYEAIDLLKELDTKVRSKARELRDIFIS